MHFTITIFLEPFEDPMKKAFDIERRLFLLVVFDIIETIK